MDEREPLERGEALLGRLREAWARVTPPAAPEALDPALLDALREAWLGLSVPVPALPERLASPPGGPLGRALPPARRPWAIRRTAAVAAALLLGLGALLWRTRGQVPAQLPPGGSGTGPGLAATEPLPAPARITVAAADADRLELRSGRVRLLLLTPNSNPNPNPASEREPEPTR